MREAGRNATTLTFLGATGTVTGSRLLVEHGGRRVLVDCGLYQGLRELRDRNWAPFPVAPSSLDAVVLTHAHLDHCGYLPALVRDGFAGPVLCTPSTAELAAIVLRDAAHLQEEDAAYARSAGFSKHTVPRPLYDAVDAERAVRRLRPVELGEDVQAALGVRVTLRNAGHVLGSASVWVRTPGASLLVSGDLGRGSHPLLRPPDPVPEVDTLVVESTYGGRRHDAPSDERVAEVIRRTTSRGGVVVVPAFAVDRTEVFLMALRRMRDHGLLPRLSVFVDSPMALSALEVYRKAVAEGRPDVRPEIVDASADPFDPGGLREARTAEESERLNAPGYPCILVSASGMATGGRVVHHLKHLLPDPRNTVLLVGFQAVGTRGRDLLDGAPVLKMHGRYVPVRAEVVAVEDYSVHADAEELLAWMGAAAAEPRTTYVVHGEPEGSQSLAALVRSRLGWTAVVPRHLERVRCG